VKVLVTGATGFIGNYVVGELLRRRLSIIANSRFRRNELDFPWLERVDYVQADLSEKKGDWFSFFKKPEMLIHLAWEGLPNYNESFHLERNLPNNCYFLQNIIEKGLEKVVITGTCFEYGMQRGVLAESLEVKPDNPYALAKDSLRKYLEKLQKQINFDLKWIRLFYMYGNGQNSNSILSQLETALEREEKVFNMSGGEQLRDYLPVEKVAEYIVRISIQDKISGIINCCSGKPISIRQLVENYLEKRQKNIRLNLCYYPYPDHEPMAFWGDDTKLRTILCEAESK